MDFREYGLGNFSKIPIFVDIPNFMHFRLHETNQGCIAEYLPVQGEGISIDNISDLMANARYQGADSIVIREESLDADFFDLKTGIAGEILQKFSNYNMKLVITGDFSKYSSQSLRDFIRESNRGNQIFFVSSLSEALEKLA